jgi:hypothetical protein
MAGQSRIYSLIESSTNVVSGFGIAVLANYAILPLFGFRPTVREAFDIAVIFMALSFARSYAVRRVFNRWHK